MVDVLWACTLDLSDSNFRALKQVRSWFVALNRQLDGGGLISIPIGRPATAHSNGDSQKTDDKDNSSDGANHNVDGFEAELPFPSGRLISLAGFIQIVVVVFVVIRFKVVVVEVSAAHVPDWLDG